MKNIGLLAVLGFASAFGNEFAIDSIEPLQHQVQPDLQRYISVDLTGIPNLHGIVNVGLRQESEKHGYDFGISAGKARSFMQTHLYGSYLRFIDASETAKYYLGAGLKGGSLWSSEDYALETSSFFSAGRSYSVNSGSRQFFEINLHWLNFIHFNHSIPYHSEDELVYKRKNFFSLLKFQVGIFYGWFF